MFLSKHAATTRASLAALTIEARMDGKLELRDIIELTDGRDVTVADILANPKNFHGETCADPIEGRDYGTSTAIIDLALVQRPP